MRKKSLTIICILFSLMMVNSGFNKFFNYMPMPEMSKEMMQTIEAFMTIKWVFPLVAIVEIIGGILLTIPKTRALGAIVILPVIAGIFAQHLTYDIEGIGVALVLLGINLWVIVENKKKYLPILNNEL